MSIALGSRFEAVHRPMLEVRDLVMDGADGPAVNGVSFGIGRGEVFTLLGPSASGKTALLRGVAGLDQPRLGRVTLDGELVRAVPQRAHASPDIAAVFFADARWPRETVAEAVGEPLENLGMTSAVVRGRITEALAKTGVGQLAKRAVARLSSGEQLRVALARALVKNPRLLVLDEPFAPLDAGLRAELRSDLGALGVSILCATQDQETALALPGRIAVMRAGRIVETGAPTDLYLRPQHPFTARFLGQAVLIEGRRVAGTGEGVLVDTDIGSFVASQAAHAGTRGYLMIRPEFIEMIGREVSAANLVTGTVRGSVFAGRFVAYTVETGRGLIRVDRPATRIYTLGEPVRLRLPAERCVFLPRDDA